MELETFGWPYREQPAKGNARDVACPECGAAPQQPCLEYNGHMRPNHTSRGRAAREVPPTAKEIHSEAFLTLTSFIAVYPTSRIVSQKSNPG